jgi:hypothetical protein
MAALDRMLGRKASDEQQELGPLGGLLASILPREQITKMTGDVTGMIQYFKVSMDTVMRQNVLIIENQRRIMAKLEIEDDGSDNGNCGNNASGNADA